MSACFAKELPDIDYCEDPYACVRGADALVIITEWAQFCARDLKRPKRPKREMAQSVIVDLHNIYRPDNMAALGFTYESIGRRRMSPINLVEGGRTKLAPQVRRRHYV